MNIYTLAGTCENHGIFYTRAMVFSDIHVQIEQTGAYYIEKSVFCANNSVIIESATNET